MILCDLCGQSKECLQKEIDSKEYDICSDCWNPLAEKLKGKGRAQKSREIVLLPPPRVVSEREDAKPLARSAAEDFAGPIGQTDHHGNPSRIRQR